MITRSTGITTGLGYLVGNGYEGETKKLDDGVLKIADLLKKTFNKNIEIRYNSNRKSGGAFVKDTHFSDQIGLGAGLHSSKFNAMTTEEKIKLSDAEIENLPRDMILYHAVLADNLAINPNRKDIYKYFKTLKGAYNWLRKHMNETTVQAYLNDLK